LLPVLEIILKHNGWVTCIRLFFAVVCYHHVFFFLQNLQTFQVSSIKKVAELFTQEYPPIYGSLSLFEGVRHRCPILNENGVADMWLNMKTS
jgi:hypothetical protein